MEPLEPIGPPPVQGAFLTEEWLIQQKKLLKQAKMEASETLPAEDVYTPSSQAAKISQDKYTAFAELMRLNLQGLDKNSSQYLHKAITRLVSTALGNEFGKKLLQDPAYPQMEALIANKILNNPAHTEIIKDFLELLSDTQPNE
jgi:hypothetical protein